MLPLPQVTNWQDFSKQTSEAAAKGGRSREGLPTPTPQPPSLTPSPLPPLGSLLGLLPPAPPASGLPFCSRSRFRPLSAENPDMGIPSLLLPAPVPQGLLKPFPGHLAALFLRHVSESPGGPALLLRSRRQEGRPAPRGGGKLRRTREQDTVWVKQGGMWKRAGAPFHVTASLNE